MALINKKINAPSGVDDELWSRAMDTYIESEKVKKYEQQKNAAENAVSGYKRNPALTGVQDKILNRPKFNYDFSTDPLYLQYKDHYQRHGKQAMTDTVAQAAALTGGYGNSYAATAGQQTYNSYMQDLNAVLPELYDRARSEYDAEGDELYNMYNMLYGEERDTLGDLRGDRDYYSNAYRAEAADDYSKFSDNRSAAMDLSQMQNGDWWNKTNFDYQKEQDALSRASASASAKSSGGSGSGDGKSVNLFKYADSYKDSEDNNKEYSVFYDSNGKKYTVERGVNPYTGTRNEDAKNGTFSNGYQPDNIGGQKLSQYVKNGVPQFCNPSGGREQKVWTTDGKNAYYWDGTKNRYILFED